MKGWALRENGASDKGQVLAPSAALMGRAQSDPSPEEHRRGQSIVPKQGVFRVTSAVLPAGGGSWLNLQPKENISSPLLLEHDARAPKPGRIYELSSCTWNTVLHHRYF